MDDRRMPLETTATASFSSFDAVPSEMMGMAAIAVLGGLIFVGAEAVLPAAVLAGAGGAGTCGALGDATGSGAVAASTGIAGAFGTARGGDTPALGGGAEWGRGTAEGIVATGPVVRPSAPRTGSGRGGTDGRAGLVGGSAGGASAFDPATSVMTTTFASASSSSSGFFALAKVLEMRPPLPALLASAALPVEALSSRSAPSRAPASSSGFGAGVSLKPPPRATHPVELGPWLWQSGPRRRARRRRWPSIRDEKCRSPLP
jgi:hypothetical protein